MVRTNQGGSILNFIIIGVVLGLLVIGGAYFVRQRTQLASDAPAPAPTETTAPVPEEADKTPAANDENTESETPVDQTETQTPAEQAPDASSAPEQTQNTDVTGSEDTATSSAKDSSDTLPQTGPVQTTASLITLGLISYSATAYVQSRRARKATLTSLL